MAGSIGNDCAVGEEGCLSGSYLVVISCDGVGSLDGADVITVLDRVAMVRFDKGGYRMARGGRWCGS